MKTHLICALGSILLLASACASPSKRVLQSSTGEVASAAGVLPDPQDEITCDMERTVGTMIPKRICRSVQDSEKSRAATKETLRNLRPNDIIR
jgi:hypothetical protein